MAAHQVPDHTTIARFRQRHQDAVAGLFGEVLALCAEAGLVQAEVIAVDGTKVQANASERAACDYERIARDVLAEADAVDAEEDERLGDRRGDELPEPLGTARVARSGLLTPSAGSNSAAPKTGGRSRRRGRRGRAKPGAGWKKSTTSRCRRTRRRGVPGARRRQARQEVRPAAQPLHATAGAGWEDQHHRPGLAQRQDAARVGAGPQRGRKTDVSDAAWLCQLAEAGLLKTNFVPPKPIRQLRNLTRYRKTQGPA